jgi:hypothetical protein
VSTLKPDVFAGHRLAGLGIDAGVLDAVAGVPVDLVEADLFGIGRGRIERDRTGDERKAQEAFPVGAGGPWTGTPVTMGFKTNEQCWFRHPAPPARDSFSTIGAAPPALDRC